MASLDTAGAELGLRLRMTKIVAHSPQQNFVWAVAKLNIQNTKIWIRCLLITNSFMFLLPLIVFTITLAI